MAINKAETRHHINIAFAQADISSHKSQAHRSQGNKYAATMYHIRATALRAYAVTLQQKLKKAERKTFKRTQNEY